MESNGVTIPGMTGDGKTVRKARARPTELGAAKPLHILTTDVTARGVVNMTALAAAQARP